jgi:nicotinate-nucleotide adenylyltransferase
MRRGVFGGSFDPVHYGHLLLAESCREACSLDLVLFVPTAVSPHKQDQLPSEARHRIEMLKLAIGGHPAFDVSEIEIRRAGISFTVDTLRELHRENPQDELFLLMGADSCEDFPTWRQPSEICQLASLVVVGRAGSPIPDLEKLKRSIDPQQAESIRCHFVEMPCVDYSSSRIRERVAAGQSIRFQTPRAVEMYIQTHSLYVRKE